MGIQATRRSVAMRTSPPAGGRTRRLLLLSDTHGVIDSRVAALADGCDTVIHAGDVGSAEVLQQLRGRAARVFAVRGNNDGSGRWPQGDCEAFLALPDEACLELPGGLLVAVHGHRHGGPRERHARLRRAYPEARLVLYGHSHHLALDREALPWVVNPGAAGRMRTFGGPSCLVLTVQGDEDWRIEVHRFALHAAT